MITSIPDLADIDFPQSYSVHVCTAKIRKARQALLIYDQYSSCYHSYSTAQKTTIHQVTAMLSTSKNALFPGHNHLLTTGAGDLTL